MSTEGAPDTSLVPFTYSREAIGQIRFDPSEGLRERLADLFIPAKREIGRRSLFLSSQYKLIAQQASGGVIKGKEGQVAEHIDRALRPGKDRNNRLGKYMRKATVERGGQELLALQFAVHLDPQIMAAIDRDVILASEPLLPQGVGVVKAVLVYEAANIVEGKERDKAIRAIGTYVTGQEIILPNGGNIEQKSPNLQAYTNNLRFTFSPPHLHV